MVKRLIVHSLVDMDARLESLAVLARAGKVKGVTVAGWCDSIVITWWEV